MNRYVPFLVILLELSAIGLLSTFICIAAVFFSPRPAKPSTIPVIEQVPFDESTDIDATPIPTASVTPTDSPTLTPTLDPRKIVSACSAIETPGLYVLTGDISSNSANDCLKIATSDATLDCQGNSIQGLAYNGIGIAVRKYGVLASQVPSAVEIRNCNVSKFHFGIFVEAGTRISIHDNTSSNNYDDVDRGSRYGIFLGMTEGGGIRVNNALDSSIWNNTTMTQAIGIDIRFSSRVLVRSNTSSNNSAWGINVMRTTNSEISGNSTTDNIRECTWGAGVIGLGCDAGGIILQDGSSNIIVSGNQVLGKNGNGIFIKAHAEPCGNNNTIAENTIVGALYNSIELSFCTGIKINNNTFKDGMDAIWLGFAHHNEIKDNTIVNMKNHGIISSNSHDNMISGNHITNANVGLLFYSESYNREFFYFLDKDGDYTSHGNCLCNNVFKGNNVSVHLNDSWNNRVTGNDFRGNARGILLQGNTKGTDTQGNLF